MEDHNTKTILSAITGLSDRMDVMETTQRTMSDQIGGMTNRMDGMSDRMDGMSDQIGGMSDRMDGITNRMDGMSDRIDASEQNVLEAISGLADHVEGIDTRLTRVESSLTQVDTRLVRVEATMVTKSYLDDKLGGLKGDMVSMVRKEDEKVNGLVSVLAKKSVLTPREAKEALSIRLFP